MSTNAPTFIGSPAEFERAISVGGDNPTIETEFLDFKGNVERIEASKEGHPGKVDRVELACDIVQFANSWGGTLVFGVREGFDRRNHRTYAATYEPDFKVEPVKTAIKAAIKAHVVPGNIRATTRDFVVADDRPIVVVNVRPSPTTVTVWNEPRMLFPYRVSNGKEYMDPIEAQRRISTHERAIELRWRELIDNLNGSPLYVDWFPTIYGKDGSRVPMRPGFRVMKLVPGGIELQAFLKGNPLGNVVIPHAVVGAVWQIERGAGMVANVEIQAGPDRWLVIPRGDGPLWKV